MSGKKRPIRLPLLSFPRALSSPLFILLLFQDKKKNCCCWIKLMMMADQNGIRLSWCNNPSRGRLAQSSTETGYFSQPTRQLQSIIIPTNKKWWNMNYNIPGCLWCIPNDFYTVQMELFSFPGDWNIIQDINQGQCQVHNSILKTFFHNFGSLESLRRVRWGLNRSSTKWIPALLQLSIRHFEILVRCSSPLSSSSGCRLAKITFLSKWPT